MLFRVFLIILLVAMSFFVPEAHAIILPKPGTMVELSAAFQPVLIKGLKLHADNPLLFDFIVDTGTRKISVTESSAAIQNESNRLIKYFLSALTIPEKDLWVNLSPFEQDRKMSDNLGQTQMGQDMLAQDYLLKQLTASLIYPEKGLGKKFWDRVYAQSKNRFGTTEVPLNAFNKVWIVAETADVYEGKASAYVTKAHLKVMMEEDYLATAKNRSQPGDISPTEMCPQAGCQATNGLNEKAPQGNNSVRTLSSNIIKEIILPAIETEINEGENFAALRQMYHSMILATWYKKRLKNSLLTQAYGNQSKVGVTVNVLNPNETEEIFQQYLHAYKKGVFNFIKDEPALDGTTAPRKYFSGGLEMQVDKAMRVVPTFDMNSIVGHTVQISIGVRPFLKASQAMSATTPQDKEQRNIVVIGDASLSLELANEEGHFTLGIESVLASNLEKLNQNFMEDDTNNVLSKGIELVIAPRHMMDQIEHVIEGIGKTKNVRFKRIKRIYFHPSNYKDSEIGTIRHSENVFIVSSREAARKSIPYIFNENYQTEVVASNKSKSLITSVGVAIVPQDPFAALRGVLSRGIENKVVKKSHRIKQTPENVQQESHIPPVKINSELRGAQKILFALNYHGDSINDELMERTEKLLWKQGFVVIKSYGDLDATTKIQNEKDISLVLSFRSKYRAETLENEAIKAGLRVVPMTPISKPKRILDKIIEILTPKVNAMQVLYVTHRVHDVAHERVVILLRNSGHKVYEARGIERVNAIIAEHSSINIVLGFNKMYQAETLTNIARHLNAKLFLISQSSMPSKVVKDINNFAGVHDHAMSVERIYENKRVLIVTSVRTSNENQVLRIKEYLESKGANVIVQNENVLTNPWKHKLVSVIVGVSVNQKKLDRLSGIFEMGTGKKTVRVESVNVDIGNLNRWMKDFIVSVHNIINKESKLKKILVVSRLERSKRREGAIALLRKWYDVHEAYSEEDAREKISSIKPSDILFIQTLHPYSKVLINNLEVEKSVNIYDFGYGEGAANANQIVSEMLENEIDANHLENKMNNAMTTDVLKTKRNILVVQDDALLQELIQSEQLNTRGLANVSTKSVQASFDYLTEDGATGIDMIVAPFILREQIEDVLYILSRRDARFAEIKRLYYEPPSNQKRLVEVISKSQMNVVVPDKFSVKKTIEAIYREGSIDKEIILQKVDYSKVPVLLVTVGEGDRSTKKELGFDQNRYASMEKILPLNQFHVLRSDVLYREGFELKLKHIFDKHQPQHIVFDVNGSTSADVLDNMEIAATVMRYIKALPERKEVEIFYRGKEMTPEYGSTVFGLKIHYFDDGNQLKQSLEAALARSNDAIQSADASRLLKGGIDFDASQLQMNIDQERAELHTRIDFKIMEQFAARNFAGLVYTIHSIIPVANITQILQ